MASKIWTYANPNKFMGLSEKMLPWVASAAVVLFGVGIVWGLFLTPDDYQQRQTVKIIFIHVPAAMLAINIYIVMIVASLVGLIRSHPVSHLVAKAAAPVGAAFTLIAFLSGLFWGYPMWGLEHLTAKKVSEVILTDARLVSVLVLFFFYLGYMSLWSAIEDPVKAADLAAILCLFGSIFAFLSRYASHLFYTLHQGSSMSLDKAEHIHDSFYLPLIVMIVAQYLIFITLLLIGVRTEIRARRIRSLRLAEMSAPGGNGPRASAAVHG